MHAYERLDVPGALHAVVDESQPDRDPEEDDDAEPDARAGDRLDVRGRRTDMRLAIIEHVVVNLIRHDGEVGMAHEPGHELVDFGLWRDAAGRIGRRIKDRRLVSAA